MTNLFNDPNSVASYEDLKKIVRATARQLIIERYAKMKDMTPEEYESKLTSKEKAELDERSIVEAVDVAVKLKGLADRVSLGFAYTAVQRKLHERFDETDSVFGWLKQKLDSDVSQESTSAAFLFEMLSIMDEKTPGYSDTLFPDAISFRKLIRNIPLMRKRRETLFLTQKAVEEDIEREKNNLEQMKKSLKTIEDPAKREKVEAAIDTTNHRITVTKKEGLKQVEEANVVLQETIKAVFEVANTRDISREESPMFVEDKVQKSLEKIGVRDKPAPQVEKPIAYYYQDGRESVLVITSKKQVIIRILGIISKFVDSKLAEPEELVRLVKSKIKKVR